MAQPASQRLGHETGTINGPGTVRPVRHCARAGPGCLAHGPGMARLGPIAQHEFNPDPA